MRFEIYEDGSGQWRWRLVAKNGKVIADGAEGYMSERNVRSAVRVVKETTHSISAARVMKGEWKRTTSGPTDRNLRGILLGALAKAGA